MSLKNFKKFSFLLITLLLGILIGIIYYQVVEHFEPQSSDPILLKVKERLRKVYPEIDKLEFYESNRSYTINKHKVHICLKDEKGEYYEINMLMYVTLHELAHVLCNEVGHTDKFYKIFQDLLDKAYDLGVYDPSVPIVQNYCQY